MSLRAGVERHQTLRWLIERPLMRWKARHQPGLSLNHHVARIGRCRAHQMYDSVAPRNPLPNRLRAGSSFAKAAPSLNEPITPIAGRDLLRRPRFVAVPVVKKRCALRFAKLAENRFLDCFGL